MTTAVLLTLLVSPLGPAPLNVVDNLDPARYAGRWYEIARLPNRFQNKCASDVVANYQPRAEGGFTVVNSCRNASGEVTDASGVARRVQGAPPSVLQVRFAPSILSFLPQVWGDYQVIALDQGHTYSLVGTPDRKYLWILSRTPRIEPATYDQLVERAATEGFDVTRLTRTSHTGQ
jgi:apolipoprotein D and lipocalin family protein